MLEKCYSAAGLVVSLGIDTIEKFYPALLAFAGKIDRDIFFDDPLIEIFPADIFDFAVDKQFAVLVLIDSRIYVLLTSDTDVIHVVFSTPNHVHREEHVCLTFRIFFVIMHV